MKKIPIDKENLFKEKLQTGINLFTGAGFSCLPDEDGVHLPTREELCPEICEKFGVSADFGTDLESLSALAEGTMYQRFLRERFTVTKCSSEYLLLNRIKLNSYITTNIDNIIHLITEGGNRYYLKSITYYGRTRRKESELCYIPLHGEVTNEEYPLSFGRFDLAVVDDSNRDLFEQMNVKLREAPVLFWGYGFHDSGVLKTVKKMLSNGPKDIWIQCLPTDNKQMTLFRELGCNIIQADTAELFQWIRHNLDDAYPERERSGIIDDSTFEEYRIPTINQVPVVTVEDFYVRGNTQWYSILAKQAVELDFVSEICDKAAGNKNVILIGTDFSGKTTALMQCALKIDKTNKLFLDNLIWEQAIYLVNQIAGREVTIFLDNCSFDMKAYRLLAKTPNIQTIAASSDYSFEASKHVLSDVAYEKVVIEDLTQRQAYRFFNEMDPRIRNNKLSYKEIDEDKFSVLEMILSNVKNVLQRSRIKKMINRIAKENPQVFEVVALTSYLSQCDSALSTDILFIYFNLHSYKEARRLVETANGFLRSIDVTVACENADQDYFLIRSKLFLHHLKDILFRDKDTSVCYADVVEKFIRNISPYIIYNFHEFKRRAYDSDMFYTLFAKKANSIYQYLYEYDHNVFTLQQWALCRSKLKQFKEAFADIDKAMGQLPNNFSIQNSRAIILFEANRNETSELAKEKLYEAMDILEKCYKNDKRRVYHAQKYAEFALHLYHQLHEDKYISQARRWIDEIIRKKDSLTKLTMKYQKQLEEIDSRLS